MFIGFMKVKLYSPWVHSLKEKRMVVKSICSKVHNKFNVSISEVSEQDTHQTIIIGIACAACSISTSDSLLNNVLKFIESNTEAEVFVLDNGTV